MTNSDAIALISSVLVPIIVALISSGKMANTISKKMGFQEVSQKLNDLDYKIDRNQADSFRSRILRFNSEIRKDENSHDQEEFNDILSTIDGYEAFCKAHEDYRNNKCTIAVDNIRRIYKEKLEDNSF
jgi:hypothetical protein